jgi:hypothetical protein
MSLLHIFLKRWSGLAITTISCAYITGNAVFIFHEWHYSNDKSYKEFSERFPHTQCEPALFATAVIGVFVGTALIMTA